MYKRRQSHAEGGHGISSTFLQTNIFCHKLTWMFSNQPHEHVYGFFAACQNSHFSRARHSPPSRSPGSFHVHVLILAVRFADASLCCPCTRCPLDRGPLPCCDRGQRWNVRQQKHRPWLIVKAARLDLSNDWQGYFRVLLVVFYCLLFIYKQSLALDIPT